MVAARVQVGVGPRGLGERVGPPHRNGEPAAGRQGGQFRQGLGHAVRRVRAGEPDAVVRGVVVGDGDDARRVSGQADRAGEQAAPVVSNTASTPSGAAARTRSVQPSPYRTAVAPSLVSRSRSPSAAVPMTRMPLAVASWTAMVPTLPPAPRMTSVWPA